MVSDEAHATVLAENAQVRQQVVDLVQVLGRRRMGVCLTAQVAHLRTSLRLPLRAMVRYLADLHSLRVSVGDIVDLLHCVAARGRREWRGSPRRPARARWRRPTRTSWREDELARGRAGARTSWPLRLTPKRRIITLSYEFPY